MTDFDEYAKTWDTEIRINRARKVAEEIINSIDLNMEQTAMEFGCGTGLVSFNLHDRFKTITLIDTSKGMIDILNSKIDTYRVKNMMPYQMDLTSEDTSDMKFDVIYNSMVLHHVHDYEAVIRKFYELLNENGYLCIVDLNEEDGSFHSNYDVYDGHNGFNQEHLRNVLKDAGFEDVESKTFYYDQKQIEDRKVDYSLFLMKARKR